jgi:hypothetical protein
VICILAARTCINPRVIQHARACTIESQSTTSSCSKASRGEPRGAQSGHKHRQLSHQVVGVTLIHDVSMAIIFNTPITFNVGEVFRFGSLSCIVDQEGVLHRRSIQEKIFSDGTNCGDGFVSPGGFMLSL